MFTARIQHSNTTPDTLIRPSTTLCIGLHGFSGFFGDWFRIDPKLLIMDFLKSPIVRLLQYETLTFFWGGPGTIRAILWSGLGSGRPVAVQLHFTIMALSVIMSCLVLPHSSSSPCHCRKLLCKGSCFGSWHLSKWWLARHDWVSSNSRKSDPREESSLVTHIEEPMTDDFWADWSFTGLFRREVEVGVGDPYLNYSRIGAIETSHSWMQAISNT